MLKEGLVEKVVETPSKFNDKAGRPKPSFWRIRVDNTSYGMGAATTAPCKEGDYVQFEAVQDGQYWNVAPGTLKPAKAPERAPASETTSATADPTPTKPTTGGNTWRTDPERETRAERVARQETISYQSARKDALEHVSLLLAAGAMDFGRAGGAQKIEIVDILVDEYTKRYYAETQQLAPREHASPVDAMYAPPLEAQRKAPRKARAVLQNPEIGQEESNLPWPE